jgi:hypothetical protein
MDTNVIVVEGTTYAQSVQGIINAIAALDGMSQSGESQSRRARPPRILCKSR